MEQRACYRVATHLALEQFQLRLELPDGTICPARMDEVSARGLMARTAHRIETPLSLGSRVTLHITCAARGVALRLGAVVRGVQQQSEKSWYGLEFDDSGHLERALPADLFGLFNRRRTPRRRVADSPRPLSVAADHGPRTLGSLRDISISGASLSVTASEDPGFRVGERISIAGRLDAAGERVLLTGHVRRARKAHGGCLYGVEFDPETRASSSARLALERCFTQLQPAHSRTSARRIADRRISQRARPSPETPIQVELWAEGKRSARATLLDLSATGAGVSVPALDDPEFGDDEAMQIRLRLPVGELGLIARVRRGLLVDDQVCYGLEFDTELSTDFQTHQEAIRSFVASHFGSEGETPMIAYVS